MVQEVNRIISSIGDYSSTISSRDLNVIKRKGLLALTDRSNADSVLLAVALSKFNFTASLNVFDDNFGNMLTLIDDLTAIQYSILYHINPEFVNAVTDNSTLIDIIPIEEIIEIGKYCDSLVENGIQSLANYNNSIMYVIRETNSPILNELLQEENELNNDGLEVGQEPNTVGNNEVQAKFKQYLGVFSFIYSSMFKMINKYVEPFNELDTFNNKSVYFIAVSSYLLTNSFSHYDNNANTMSKKYSRRFGNLHKQYSDNRKYRFNGDSSLDISKSVTKLFMYEFSGTEVNETSCSSNITFNEYAYLTTAAVMSHTGDNAISATHDIKNFKIKAFAQMQISSDFIEIMLKFELISIGSGSQRRDSASVYKISIHLEPEQLTDFDLHNAILHEVALNFNKYVHAIGYIAYRLETEYDSALINNVYVDYNAKDLVKIDSSRMEHIVYIDINDMPNMVDIIARSKHRGNKSSELLQQMIAS